MNVFKSYRSFTHWLLNIHSFFKKQLALILNHLPFKSKEFHQNFFICVDFGFSENESMFLGTANLKRTVTPKHGAM